MSLGRLYLMRDNTFVYSFKAMVSLLDKSVGKVIDALYQKNILQNTIILFYSDNGGRTKGGVASAGSNYPLRGQKNSPWEGGVRSSGAIWSPKIEKLNTVYKQRFYVADLLPTLATAAGIQLDGNIKFDGLDLWSALKYGYESVEREIVHNIDEIFNYYAYVSGKWKLINGTTLNGDFDGWLGSRALPNETDPRSRYYEDVIRNTTVWQQLNAGTDTTLAKQTNISKLRQDAAINCLIKNGTQGVPCNPLSGPCLFDIDVDPCEQNNLYDQQKNSKLVQQMLTRIENFRLNARPPNNLPSDPLADPSLYHDEWTWWQDENSTSSNSNLNSPMFYVLQFFCLFLYFAFCGCHIKYR